MRSACPPAMITSRLTPRSFPTRSSSLDLASGRITYRSKSKLTVDAVVTFSAFGAAFGGAGGGGGGGAGGVSRAGAGGAGSGVAAQPANASRTNADSAVLSLLFMLSSRRLGLEPRLEQLGYAFRKSAKTPALSFCFCCQLILPHKGAAVQAAILESDELSLPDPGLPRDPHMRYLLAARRIHQMRDRVVAGGELGLVEGDRAQIGELARRKRPDRCVEAERAGAVQRRRGKRTMRRHRLRVVPGRLCEKRGGAHLLEQVEAVVARRAVGADADIDAALEHGGDGRETARELQVRRGAMRDGGAVVREHRNLLARDVHRVRRDEAR